jgi:hypothetical protein
MKIERSTIVSFILLVLIASLYRIVPNRPMGFAPQIAMAIFAGSVITNRKASFLLPLLSMFISDLFYQVLFTNGLTHISGFYSGQLTNYILIGLVTVVGFMVKKDNVRSIVYGAVFGATAYFIASNLLVWLSGGLDINNMPYAKSLSGLAYCYAAAIPFYRASIYATLLFSGVLFGGYYLVNRYVLSKNNTVTA